jgi:hypothetical protein
MPSLYLPIPLWACLLLSSLAILGLRGCGAGRVTRLGLIGWPMLLAAVALGLIGGAQERWLGLCGFAAGLAVGLPLARFIFNLDRARVVGAGVHLPGSVTPLLMYCAYGGWVCYLSHIEMQAYAPARVAYFYYVASGFLGLFCGLLAGRSLRLLKLLRGAWARGRRR